MSRTLTLPLKGIYFDEIRAGTKWLEYRLRTPYWEKRMASSLTFSHIVLTKGYPAKDDAARRMELPWRGYMDATITHPHFGPKPVKVFAIIVGEPITPPQVSPQDSGCLPPGEQEMER